MSVSIIDGTIEEAVLKRSALNIRIFRHVRFRLRDGSTKSVVKPIVDAGVARLLQPGASGRFYLYTSIDQRGIHGVRDDQGHAEFGFPKNNEIAMLVIFLLNLAWVTASILTVQDAPILGTLLLLLSGPYWLYLRHLRGEARRQFEADSHYAPASAPAPAAPIDAEPAVSA